MPMFVKALINRLLKKIFNHDDVTAENAMDPKFVHDMQKK